MQTVLNDITEVKDKIQEAETERNEAKLALQGAAGGSAAERAVFTTLLQKRNLRIDELATRLNQSTAVGDFN